MERLAVVRAVCKVNGMPSVLNRVIMLMSVAALTTPSAAQAPDKVGAYREINITSDSAQGWLPSEELERNAKDTVERYFAAMDGGRYRDAYEMMSDANKAQLSYKQFEQQSKQFQAQAGPLRRRDILKITWTKDPADAPYPGIYAAIDEASSFRNVDRQCGYIILYQRPAGGAFEVIRTETNFIDNASAA